jgi:outer membrane protein assembly factor BamB
MLCHRFLFAFVACASLLDAGSSLCADWPGFRGPYATGEAARGTIPARIGAAETEAWSVDLPGRGPSSPIIVGECVIVTASSEVRNDRLHVLCFDAATGEELWHRQFWATGRTFCHPTTANAAPTPTSDGERVYAFYSSNDLVCLDLKGRFQWFRGLAFDHPKAGNDIGMSSSPLVIGDTVIAQVDNKANSFAMGLDHQTGKTRWEIERPAVSNWTTPVVVDTTTSPLAIMTGSAGIVAIDPRSGERRWELPVECATIPSATVKSGVLVAPVDGVTAFRLRGTERPEFAWQSNRLRPNTNSPVIARDSVFAANSAGVLTAANLSNGAEQWRLRLKGPVWATPVAAGSRLLVVSGGGLLQVVEIADGKGRLSHTAELKDTIQATPAVGKAGTLIRSDKKLWCFR